MQKRGAFLRAENYGVSSHTFTIISPRSTIQKTTLRNHFFAKTSVKRPIHHSQKKAAAALR
ncbi:hypothetical protein [Granulicella sp. S190]|uniref:hypothetical protein n=1 Tax=Granulicella sp. S190 TaxID=1747226 RepID=UPI00131D3EBD|nr:hypothetical protein [Granulicella sp. S190]